MGTLTNCVKQMCDEIVDLRNKRQTLNQCLTSDTQSRKGAVSEMCADFTKMRLNMAQKTLKDRRDFMANLQQVVNAQRSDMQMDLAGVRQAWAGK